MYLVTMEPRLGADMTQMQATLNLADDCYRFGPMMWIIVTDDDASVWQKRLLRFAKPGGRLFVCRLDTKDKQGWMPKRFWRWLRECEIDGDLDDWTKE